MTSRVTGLAALALSVMLQGHSLALEPKRLGQETSLSRAIYAEGEVWLLSDAGEVSRVAEDKSDRLEALLPEPALDLWLHDGRPAVITCKRELCTDWTVRLWDNGNWVTLAKVPTQNDAFVGVGQTGSALTLLTSHRIVDAAGDSPKTATLSQPLPSGLVTSVYMTPDSIFVGINAGEWGGGLRRIDRKSGKVSKIERNASGRPCGGPLNSDCDPVNAIVGEPWKENCIVAAVGLVHFVPSGRIVEVCGDEVRTIYSKPYATSLAGNKVDWQDVEPFSTVAFFGLTRKGNTLLAAGIDGIYRIEPGGDARSTPLPAFKQIGGIRVSFDLPDVILILTDINGRRSMSGSVPILVSQ